jgi:hypothetical protein
VKENAMQAVQKGYDGLSLLMELNWDRILYVSTIVFALAAGAWLGSFIQ